MRVNLDRAPSMRTLNRSLISTTGPKTTPFALGVLSRTMAWAHAETAAMQRTVANKNTRSGRLEWLIFLHPLLGGWKAARKLRLLKFRLNAQTSLPSLCSYAQFAPCPD